MVLLNVQSTTHLIRHYAYTYTRVCSVGIEIKVIEFQAAAPSIFFITGVLILYFEGICN